MPNWEQRLRRLLTLHEGRRRYPYLDTVGKVTIGVGRNLDDLGLSDDEIDLLLTNDLARATDDLDRALPWWRRLDPVRRAVLADMCFNLGLPRLLGFRAMLRHLGAGEYDDAADHMVESRWYRQVKTRAVRLVRMMRTGAWPSELT